MGAAGSTPIHKACQDGNLVDLRVAVQHHGSRIDDREKSMGYTGLHIAAWFGYDAMVRELLQRGANPNILDNEGRTALHLAAKQGHSDVVFSLLRHEATQRHIRDNWGRTAWEYCQLKYPKVAAMIGPSPPPPAAAAAAATAAGPRPGIPGSSAPSGSRPSQTQAQPHGAPQGAAQQQQQQGQGIHSPAAQYLWVDTPNRPIAPPIYPNLPGNSGATQPGAGTAAARPAAAAAGPAAARPQPQPPSPTAYPAISPASHAPPAAQDAAAQQPQQPQQQWLQTAAAAAAVAPPPINSHALSTHPSADSTAPSPLAPRPSDRVVSPLISPHGSVPVPSALGMAPTTLAPSAPPASTTTAAAAAAAASPGSTHTPQPPIQWPPFHGTNPLKTAAEMAMHQLARLGLGPHHNHNNNSNRPNGGPAAVPSDGSLTSPPSPSPWSNTACRMYKYEDLAQATQGFASVNLIGKGGFGEVFRGVLDGVPVAVKVMDVGPEAMQGVKELTAEINILGRLHHPHVVLLIGACPERDRVRVAAEVVSALVYLHTATPSIVHMDIKPANILLDRTLRVKLGDVGLARLMGGPLPALAPGQGHASLQGTTQPSTSHDSQLVGTLAYVDPEYLRTGQYSPKSDVYALGIVMLQLLTAQDARRVIQTVEEARKNPLHFAYVLDRSAGNWPAAEALAFADIALRCTQFRRHDRPDLRTEVLPALLQLKGRTSLWPTPNATTAPQEGRTGAATPAAPAGTVSAVNTAGAVTDGVPAMFICPITQDVMSDPVVAADGYTYEREAIAAWLTRAHTSPLTNLPLSHVDLVPNLTVRTAIKEWLEQQQQHARAQQGSR